jgi:hypothetical protein
MTCRRPQQSSVAMGGAAQLARLSAVICLVNAVSAWVGTPLQMMRVRGSVPGARQSQMPLSRPRRLNLAGKTRLRLFRTLWETPIAQISRVMRVYLLCQRLPVSILLGMQLHRLLRPLPDRFAKTRNERLICLDPEC